MTNIKLLSYKDLEERGFGSRVTIWRMVKNNQFPKSINVGHNRKWRESDIAAWLESK